VGTVSLALLTFITLVYTIIATTSERRHAATDRTTAEKRLTAERAAGEQRIRDERAHADEVRRRERQATRAVALISFIADLQHFMNVLPAASSHFRRSGRSPEHLQEMESGNLSPPSGRSGVALGLKRRCWVQAMQPKLLRTATTSWFGWSTKRPERSEPRAVMWIRC